MKLKGTYKIDNLMYEDNIADHISEDDCKAIGEEVVKNFNTDLTSRSSWERRTDASLQLALQVATIKNFPWPNASNVKFPLITIAALQYHARSYPILIDSDLPVKCRVIGDDDKGARTARAERVERHMSYQILEEDEDWEDQMDKVLITQPIVGCAFKKTYYDPFKSHNVSENILAKDLVVNYWTKSLETAPRITHVIQMSKNEIYERVARKLWCDVSVGKPQDPSVNLSSNTSLQLAQDKQQGLTRPETDDRSNPYEILEMHCGIDFDDDGYDEPYIIWVRRDTKKVARIVARYNTDGVIRNKSDYKKIMQIVPEHYFTKYPFIPSPDGGFYDLGFGVLLGPLNESINTILNQLVDCGTMANTAGGFFSRGIKLRGGNTTFNPLEWKHVDSTGDDLRKGIVPLPVREPSQVLFTLLNLLINYGERVGGAVDILQGENPGQNTPAETARTMAEQGMKVFNGIFKRTYRSLKHEFRKLYRLNQVFLAKEDTRYIKNSQGSNEGIVLKDDYKGPVSDVMPTADPSITSDQQRVLQASALVQRAAAVPGLYDKYMTEKVFLKSMKIKDIEQLLPDPKGPNALPPFVHPKLQIEQLKEEGRKADRDLKMKLGLLDLMNKAELAQAQIEKLEAEAMALKVGVLTEGQKTRIQEINTMIAMQRERREGVLDSIKTMNEVYKTMKEGDEKSTFTTGEDQNPGH